jgi:CRISPR/Cas system CSM-associated protein Csm3 (group 7 of RAMP superfamily)
MEFQNEINRVAVTAPLYENRRLKVGSLFFFNCIITEKKKNK